MAEVAVRPYNSRIIFFLGRYKRKISELYQNTREQKPIWQMLFASIWPAKKMLMEKAALTHTTGLLSFGRLTGQKMPPRRRHHHRSFTTQPNS